MVLLRKLALYVPPTLGRYVLSRSKFAYYVNALT
jgi:hypothetical protein